MHDRFGMYQNGAALGFRDDKRFAGGDGELWSGMPPASHSHRLDNYRHASRALRRASASAGAARELSAAPFRRIRLHFLAEKVAPAQQVVALCRPELARL